MELSLLPIHLSYIGVCYGVCFQVVHVATMFISGVSTLEFSTLQPFGVSLVRHRSLLMMVCGPHHKCTEWLLFLLLGGVPCYSLSCLQPFHQNGLAYSFRGLAETHLIPLPFLCGGERHSFPGSIQSNDMVISKSVVVVNPGDSGVVIGYRLMNYSHLVSGALPYSIMHSVFFHSQGVSINTVLTLTRVWILLIVFLIILAGILLNFNAGILNKYITNVENTLKAVRIISC